MFAQLIHRSVAPTHNRLFQLNNMACHPRKPYDKYLQRALAHERSPLAL